MKAIFTICLLAVIHGAFSQCLTVQAPTVVSQSAIPSSETWLFWKLSTCNMGSHLSTVTNTNVSGKLEVSACYYYGMLTSVKYYNDSLSFGNLAPGTYTLSLKVYGTHSFTSCLTPDSVVQQEVITINPTSVQKHKNSNDVKVYPQPAGDYLMVDAKNIKDIRLYNALGQDVLNIHNENTEKAQLNLSSIPAGVYILETDTGKSKIRQRIIKN